MKTAELLDLLKVKKVYGQVPLHVTGIVMDSRKVQPGNIFVCLTGEKADGHHYIEKAIGRGASLIVAERMAAFNKEEAALVLVKDSAKALARLAHHFFHYPSAKMTAIGVTGTNGKTTVTHLIHQLSLLLDQHSAVSGSLGFYLNKNSSPTANTTSDILSNLDMMKKAADHHCSSFTFEVSSHGLANGRLWGVDFDIAVFTNLTQDHLDFHKTMEQYGYTKGLLFSQLGQDVMKEKYAVINADDPWYDRYSKMTPFEVISYGLSSQADFTADRIHYNEDGMTFNMQTPEGRFSVKTILIGEFNVHNILAAAAALFAKGVPVQQIAEVLPYVYPVKGRMEKLEHPCGPDVYIDYAHTPDAIEKAVNCVMPFKKGRLIIVIGGGDFRDPPKRPIMASKASAADFVIITVNNPGHEPADTILSHFKHGMLHNQYIAIESREEAIRHAIHISKPEDLVLITDRGHQTTLLMGDIYIPYSDTETALDQLEKSFPAGSQAAHSSVTAGQRN